MRLNVRTSFRGPGGTRINASTSGFSVSKRIGPFTVNSRGHVTVRLLPGVYLRIL